MMGKGVDNKDNGVPGPGNYENSSTFNKNGCKFGTDKRPGINTVSPGPGAYDASNQVVQSRSQ